MSFTLFFKIYAHPPTVCLLFNLNPQKCKVCLSMMKVMWAWSIK